MTWQRARRRGRPPSAPRLGISTPPPAPPPTARLIPDHDIGRALSTLVRNRGEDLGLESACVTRAVDLLERWIRVGRFIHYGRTTAGALLHLADRERVSVTAAAAVCRIDGRTMKRAADDILEDLRELVEDAHSAAPALKKSRIASS